MISLVKHVLSKYHILFMKMTLDALVIFFAKSNLCLLIDVETLLGFECDYVTLESNPFLKSNLPNYVTFFNVIS